MKFLTEMLFSEEQTKSLFSYEITQCSEMFCTIYTLKSQPGDIMTDQKDINSAFWYFNCNLYASTFGANTNSFAYFQSNFNSSCLSLSDSKHLAKPITLQEQTRACTPTPTVGQLY